MPDAPHGDVVSAWARASHRRPFSSMSSTTSAQPVTTAPRSVMPATFALIASSMRSRGSVSVSGGIIAALILVQVVTGTAGTCPLATGGLACDGTVLGHQATAGSGPQIPHAADVTFPTLRCGHANVRGRSDSDDDPSAPGISRPTARRIHAPTVTPSLSARPFTCSMTPGGNARCSCW